MCREWIYGPNHDKSKEWIDVKKKLILSAAFVISLLPMLLDQYGGRRGVQEVSGLINLFCPLGLISAVLFVLGVWLPFKGRSMGTVLGAAGTMGIVASEICNFLTWHVLTITGEVSLQLSIRFAFPEFYIGLAVSVVMVVFYFLIDRRSAAAPVSGPTSPNQASRRPDHVGIIWDRRDHCSNTECGMDHTAP